MEQQQELFEVILKMGNQLGELGLCETLCMNAEECEIDVVIINSGGDEFTRYNASIYHSVPVLKAIAKDLASKFPQPKVIETEMDIRNIPKGSAIKLLNGDIIHNAVVARDEIACLSKTGIKHIFTVSSGNEGCDGIEYHFRALKGGTIIPNPQQF